jgi:predicted RNA-binding Zn ribbon-like protein
MSERSVQLITPVGNALCLDLANTVEPRGIPGGHECLDDYDDLTHWWAHTGVISRTEGRRLRAEAAREPSAAVTAYRKALTLRAAISSAFEAIADGRELKPNDLAEIDKSYKRLLGRTHLVPGSGGFTFESSGDGDLDSPMWPVVASAIELLTHGDLSSISYCAGDCRWLFLDISKNQSRRWCTMAVCGSRDKMRRHYARHRLEKS